MARSTLPRIRARRTRSRWALGPVLLATILVVLTACSATPQVAPFPNGAYSSKPNIVFVLTDDLDSGLVQFMPHVIALEHSGMTFTNYTVTDSLCCPSRASIFTGNFPHDTHVNTNVPPYGGFGAFYARHEDKDTFATALQSAGYRTALLGKYLNGYPVGNNPYGYPTDYVPPGWTDWAGVGNGYPEFNYEMNHNSNLVQYGHDPSDYLTSVVSGMGRDFIRTSALARKPFFLEVATFAPHAPFTPAPRDRGTFQYLHVPEGPSFNVIPKNAPPWLADRPPLSAKRIETLNEIYVKRVEAVQSVDRMIGDLENTLKQTNQLDNTIFVFSSDNGLHLGQHGLSAGKLTAFDTDIRVPLVVAGPGVQAGSVNKDLVQNVDLAPTFESLAGTTVPASQDGHDFEPLLHGSTEPWRTASLIEHTGPDTLGADPDAQSFVSGNPPTYQAIRTHTFTYVRYATGAREYYNLLKDPEENDNVVGSLSTKRLDQLNEILDRLHTCHGGAQCWAAGIPRPPNSPSP